MNSVPCIAILLLSIAVLMLIFPPTIQTGSPDDVIEAQHKLITALYDELKAKDGLINEYEKTNKLLKELKVMK